MGKVAPEIFQTQYCNSSAASLGAAAAEAGIKMLARGCPLSASLKELLAAGQLCPAPIRKHRTEARMSGD